MRTWLKLTGLAAIAAMATTAQAADHLDGTAVSDNSSADINDLYAFADGGSETVTMIATVEPFAADGTAFSDATDYVFHAQSMTAAGSDDGVATNIRCQFDAEQQVTCWNGDEMLVQGDASDPDAPLENADGSIKVYAGMRRDPFFFYLGGFVAARQAVLDAVAGGLTAEPSGCYLLGGATSSALLNLLNGDGGANNDNEFLNANVLSLVLEVDRSVVGADDTNPILSVWASSHAQTAM